MSEEKSPSKPVRTVGEVADLTGVSVRTLHHYDHIGHVVPSARSHSDYRLYTDADVERLHRVLVYREVGLSLEQIATLLDDPDRDELSTLEEQRRLLNERIDRLHRMVDALEELMANKNNGITLTAAEQAEIFGHDWPGQEWHAEAEKRWGDTDAWAQSRKRAAQMSKADLQAVKDEQDALMAALVAAKTSGIEAAAAMVIARPTSASPPATARARSSSRVRSSRPSPNHRSWRRSSRRPCASPRRWVSHWTRSPQARPPSRSPDLPAVCRGAGLRSTLADRGCPARGIPCGEGQPNCAISEFAANPRPRVGACSAHAPPSGL